MGEMMSFILLLGIFSLNAPLPQRGGKRPGSSGAPEKTVKIEKKQRKTQGFS